LYGHAASGTTGLPEAGEQAYPFDYNGIGYALMRLPSDL
jgi:hypothetical protein